MERIHFLLRVEPLYNLNSVSITPSGVRYLTVSFRDSRSFGLNINGVSNEMKNIQTDGVNRQQPNYDPMLGSGQIVSQITIILLLNPSFRLILQLPHRYTCIMS